MENLFVLFDDGRTRKNQINGVVNYYKLGDILHCIFTYLPPLCHIKFLGRIFFGHVFKIEAGFIGILDGGMPLLDTRKILL